MKFDNMDTQKTPGLQSHWRLSEVWQRLGEFPAITDHDTIPIPLACGRVLRHPLIAHTSHPAHDIAAMDGYAFAGSQQPQTLTMIGRAEAGNAYVGRVLQRGECVRIFTGAPLPDGSNAVAAQEDCQSVGKQILIPPSPPGTFVRHQGSDVCEGTVIATAGTYLHERDIAVALACDLATACVVRQVRIGLLATGSELRPIGAPHDDPATEQQTTLNANMPAINLGLSSPANIIHDHGIARDDPDTLYAAISRMLDSDLVITSGGVSVGDKDLVRSVLEKLGAKILFHGLRVKPGKPCLLAQKDRTLILALPGNPVSAMVGMHMIARPLLRQLRGQRDITPAHWSARCATPLPHGAARQNLARGRYVIDDQGQIQVSLLHNQDSAALHTLAQANCLISIDINAPARDIGEKCQIFVL